MEARSRDIKTFRNLQIYQSAFELQLALFRATKRWPREETYALIDQLRRSSRSIGANLAEAWAKRQYPAHFRAKLTDSDGELQETLHWLATAAQCGYVAPADFNQLEAAYIALGRGLGAMIAKYQTFCLH